MEYKRFGSKVMVRMDRGDEIVAKLKEVCAAEQIKLGTVTGIGAADEAVIGLFDTKEKKYYSKEMTGDMEIAPLIGNITTMDSTTYLHLHITLGDRENKAYAGHLNSAKVSATFEATIDVIDGSVERRRDEEIGLNLMEFG